MIKPAYIGNPSEHENAVNKLAENITRTDSGIFIVGGPSRVGKSVAISQVVDKLGFVGSEFGEVNPKQDMNSDSPFDYFSMWDKAYKSGMDVYVLGEIPINFSTSLKHIDEFYRRGVRDERPVKILFNVISRNYPAWKNTLIDDDIVSGLGDFISGYINIELLHSDKERIVQELWRFKETANKVEFRILAERLGFNPSYTENVDLGVEKGDYNEFELMTKREMGIQGGFLERKK